jgi:Glutathione S-transferase, N-terminal domain
MKLYTCYGTFKSRKPEGHPCRHAHQALTAAGYQPNVVRTGGCVLNPAFPGRREVHRLTGNYQVPTLVLDDGTIVDGTDAIVAWAQSHPAAARPSS